MGFKNLRDDAPVSSFRDVEPGSYVGILVRMIDLGTQRSDYNGKTKFLEQALFAWELPEELTDDGKPLLISKFYTVSLYEKANLRKDLESWTGKPFSEEKIRAGLDLTAFLGRSCLLTVGEKPNGKSAVKGVGPLPKGMPARRPVNPIVCFSLDPDEFDEAVFASLPEGIRAMIERSPEYQELSSGAPRSRVPGEDDEGESDLAKMSDDIPF